jgi:hypothetical protein
MSAMRGTGMVRARSDRCLFRRSQTSQLMRGTGMVRTRSDRCLFRRSQHRTMMRGGRP